MQHISKLRQNPRSLGDGRLARVFFNKYILDRVLVRDDNKALCRAEKK
jgi:hypothetical protein